MRAAPHWQRFETTLMAQVEAGSVPMSRIDDAVRRILTKKFELGLFEHPFTDRSHIDEIGSRAHRAVARQAVAKSQVLLKNQRRVLPLPSDKSTWPAPTPTTSATRPAAGRSPGRATRRTRSPATRSCEGIRQRVGTRRRDLQQGRVGADRRAATSASWSSARRRTPRASATSAARSGATTPARTACCARRRHAALRRRQGGHRQGLRRGRRSASSSSSRVGR